MSTASVIVGRPIKVENAKRAQLEMLAIEMRDYARYGREGWLRKYFDSHKKAKSIFSDLVADSHRM